jgi:hypothetical protein|tara:strand:+ start:863 stop:1153 length:291 start_codon:yes stop_codon:yes gene_type:complete
MENKTIRKISKKVKSVSRTKIQTEVSKLESNISEVSYGYRPHVVNIDGTRYTSLRAKAINRSMNQSRAGNYRYLVQNGNVVGLAVHLSNGSYRRVA